ncbi:MAG: hypothetical protein AcusKO_46430 [Acuticoccus sp.]
MIARDWRGPWHRAPRRPGPPALVRKRALVPHQVIVSCGGRVLFAAMGRTGIRTLKREGDGATPRARLHPLVCLSRATRPAPLPWRRVRAADGWCDDPESGSYNRLVKRPFAHGHESLIREDAIYDTIFATDHNQRPRVRGAGSAIFIHVARPGLTPTLGCIAFRAADWRHGIVPSGAYLIGVDPRRLSAR